MARLGSKTLCLRSLRPMHHMVESRDIGIVAYSVIARNDVMHHDNERNTVNGPG